VRNPELALFLPLLHSSPHRHVGNVQKKGVDR
jgi:hypothetical protein